MVDAASPGLARIDAEPRDDMGPDAAETRADAALAWPDPDAAPAFLWQEMRVFGEQDGLFKPDGIYRAGPEAVLVANEGSGEVLRADFATGRVEVVVDGLGAPEEVVLGNDASIYVSDDARGAVFRQARQQDDAPSPVVTRDDGLLSPEGIAVDQDGVLYVADEKAHVIMKVAPGTPPEIIADQEDGVSTPEGCALSADGGTLYWTDDRKGGVYSIDTTTYEVLTVIPSDVLGLPEAITVDPSGDLWITDNDGAATVRQFGPDGTFRQSIALPVQPGSLAGIARLDNGDFALSVWIRDGPSELWLMSHRPR